ncbi:hypothetical protein EKE94_12605 [Mesobaculum littorinae]|uniref:Uncharacterized protein n=1 Tax=Mesobaculum littorinae TaxID=2486419 RepID=A0A438AFL8_9RHOB|nr:hypothetical protein [Mesobaculum littorinae]RVV97395.1 hypothetical protein EKE94_12605 [Mesobaculum littorinae]
MFDFVLTALEEEGKGLRAYQIIVARATRMIESDPDRAAPLLLIAQMAEDFVDAHERMPLTTATVQAMNTETQDMVARLNAAWGGDDAAAKLAALTDTARAIAEMRRDRNG